MYTSTAAARPLAESRDAADVERWLSVCSHQLVPQVATAGATPAFFINRDFDKDRRAVIESGLKTAGLAGERICAVEGLAVPEILRPYFFEGTELQARLKPGEVGCYASHLKALSLIVERRLPYALILEDDALLPPDLQMTIDEVLGALPVWWDVVHLSGVPRHAVKPITRLQETGTLVRYSRIPTGTVGYLISQQGAQKFLAPRKRYWPVDTDLRRPWLFGLEVYGVVPTIIQHRSTPTSPIRELGGRARGRRGIPVPSKDSWTGSPLHCPEGIYFNLKTLGAPWWARCWLHNLSMRARRLISINLHNGLSW